MAITLLMVLRVAMPPFVSYLHAMHRAGLIKSSTPGGRVFVVLI